MKEELSKKISINSIDDLPKAGLFFCAITDDCFGCFHFNPDDKDDIDFWIGNVMWYLQPIEPVEAEKELRDELIKFWEWVNDGEISNYATRLQLIDEYLTNKQSTQN